MNIFNPNGIHLLKRAENASIKQHTQVKPQYFSMSNSLTKDKTLH